MSSGTGSFISTTGSRFSTAPATERLDQVRVVNKIFEDCVPRTTDTFWRDMLIQASRGKFPKGFTYKDNVLSYKKKNKPKPITKIISHDPEEAYRDFMAFMKSTGKYSDTDMVHMDREAQISQMQASQAEIRSWSAVPEKSRKDYVERFILFVTTTYNLNASQVKSLKQCIQMGIILGAFNKDNITVVGNRIDSINGVVMDTTTGLFKIDQTLLENTHRLILRATNKPEIMISGSIHKADALDASKIIEAMVRDYDKEKDKAIKANGGSLIPPPTPQILMPQYAAPVLLIIED